MTYHDRAGPPYNFIHLLVFRYWAIMSCGFIDGWVLSTSLWATTVNGPKFNLPHLSKDLSNVFRGYCNVKNRCNWATSCWYSYNAVEQRELVSRPPSHVATYHFFF